LNNQLFLIILPFYEAFGSVTKTDSITFSEEAFPFNGISFPSRFMVVITFVLFFHEKESPIICLIVLQNGLSLTA